MNKEVLAYLRCPTTGQALSYHDGAEPYLLTTDGAYRYPVVGGIAMLLAEDAQKQDEVNPAQ